MVFDPIDQHQVRIWAQPLRLPTVELGRLNVKDGEDLSIDLHFLCISSFGICCVRIITNFARNGRAKGLELRRSGLLIR